MFLPSIVISKSLLITLGIAATVAISHGAVYFLGSNHGKAKVQAKWDVDTNARNKAMTVLQVEVATKETAHALESKRIANEFTTLKEKHEKILATVQLDYTNRLRTSEGRASIYKRQAEGGATSRDRLVEFVTELDRSIEEGRYLVRELGQTLGQCERQRQLYNEQITNERRLY